MSLYFLALIPSEIIKQEVKILKEEFRLKYAAKQALKLPAHITLQPPFKLNDDNKISFLKVLSDFAAKENSLEIILSDFGSFPPRVIFIDVQNKQPIIEFHHSLQAALSQVKNLPPTEKRQFHPHITLATRDLKKEYFDSAWNDFKDRKYTSNFTANYLFLFRHNGKVWEIYREFALIKENTS